MSVSLLKLHNYFITHVLRKVPRTQWAFLAYLLLQEVQTYSWFGWDLTRWIFKNSGSLMIELQYLYFSRGNMICLPHNYPGVDVLYLTY